VSYRVCQRVRVVDRPHDGHHRTPGYVKGKTGSVARTHASFTNPETRAYGADGLPEQPLYLVAFAYGDVWSDRGGLRDDRIFVDVFEHWLEDAE
jgi:nitrile hydratase